ncbi:MAG: hypothetical protein AAGI07_03815 [Bacteroidota bacterium]
MIQPIGIEVNGQFLELAQSTKFSLYFRNAFFDFGVRLGNKSLPFDAPNSPENRKALGFFDLPETNILGEFASTLWLYGNKYRTGILKVSYENEAFKCTFFWGLSSKAPQLKDFKLSQLNFLFDYSQLEFGNRTGRARLLYGQVIDYEKGDVFMPIFDNPIITLRFKRSNEDLVELQEVYNGSMQAVFNAFAVRITQNFPNFNAISFSEGSVAAGIDLVWFWAAAETPVTMEVLEITTNSSVDNQDYTAFFYSKSIHDNRNKYPAVKFPVFYADNVGIPNAYLNSMTVLRTDQDNRFMVFNAFYLSPFIDLAFIIEQIALQIGFSIIGIETVADRALFTAQILNFQYSFRLGDVLPDISAADFLLNIATLYNIHFDFDEENNVLYISEKKHILKIQTQNDYTHKIRYYQGYHDKFTAEAKGFQVKIGDTIYKEGDGFFEVDLDVETMGFNNLPIATEYVETGETRTERIEVQDQQGNISFITVEVPIVEAVLISMLYYSKEMFLYNMQETGGRIDDMMVVEIDNDKALPIDPSAIYEAYYIEFMRLATEQSSLIFPAVFDITDINSINENVPFTLNNQKYMPTEFRLEIENSKRVIGEVYCRRIF